MTEWFSMTTIKPSSADQDFQNWVSRSSTASREPSTSDPSHDQSSPSFADQLAKAQTAVSPEPSSSGLTQHQPHNQPSSQPSSPAHYIPSTGQGDDKNVHHRLPDGTPVTYDDIRRAVDEGRGDEDVSPYFTGQTNAQALAAHGFAETIEQAPRLVGGVAAVATRSWFSLLSSITDSFGFGEKIRTAMADDSTKTKPSKDPFE
jgi:hypothetical protein